MALDSVAVFPTSVWDGDSGNRDSDNDILRAPDYQDWDRLVAEVSATETRIYNNERGIDDDAVDSVGTLETVTGLSVVEKGNGAIHKTVITLATVSCVSTDAGANGAQTTKKLYTFPEGQIVILGAHAVFPLGLIESQSPGGTGYADDTDFSIGVGSATVVVAVDLTTTEQNICAKMDVDLAIVTTNPESNAIESGINAALLPLDGSGTAIPVWLNTSTLDNADHGAAADELVISGTITIVWTMLNDG